MNFSDREASQALEDGLRVVRSAPKGEVFSHLCRWLRKSYARYDWVGVYLLEGESLFLAAWDGEHATEHTTIPLALGICGMAARERRIINVKDVRQRPEYLACFLETRSEIVVPIQEGRVVLGEIDIDGKEEGAYDASDERFLEQLAKACVPAAIETLKSGPPRGI
jgi:L-methionine (R)-S-oxide reductase